MAWIAIGIILIVSLPFVENFLLNKNIPYKNIEYTLVTSLIVASLDFLIVILIASKYNLKLEQPKTKIKQIKYNTFNDYHLNIREKLLNENYEFLKLIEINTNLNIYLYMKNKYNTKRLIVLIKANEYNEKGFDKHILDEVYKKNIDKKIIDGVKFKEIIIVYLLDKFNNEFEENFINNVFIFNNYLYTYPIGIVFDKKNMYIPKLYIAKTKYMYKAKKIKENMKKDITKILE